MLGVIVKSPTAPVNPAARIFAWLIVIVPPTVYPVPIEDTVKAITLVPFP